MRTLHVLIVGATLAAFAAVSARPQEPGLEVMHVPAPEFPPPAGLLPASGDLAGGMIGGAPSGVQQPGSAAIQKGAATRPDTLHEGEASAPGAGVNWLNSPPLKMAGMRGKVVMIDFWDPTCINCIRTYPINKGWWDRYRRYGFEIVGVEDPEFDIAGSLDDVRGAVKRFGLPYPILVDSAFQVWKEYKSQSWPNRFLIDANGYIRYHIAGEGDDAEFERAIQGLLKEAHPELAFPFTYGIAPDRDVWAPACGGAPTPEMYVGDWFGHGTLANPQSYRDGQTIDYQSQEPVNDGHVVLAGRWETQREGMTYRGKHKGDDPGDDHAAMRYHARELYAVMNVVHGRAARVYIMQDGKYLTSANKGVDVQIDSRGRSYIEVREPRMYYVVQNPEFASHTLKILPTRSGFGLNSFTFGNDCQTQFDHF